MAITVNRATLARQVNGNIEYIYPKTYADLVEYDSSQSVKVKIDSIITDIDAKISTKVDKPLNKDGSVHNGENGQVLESNGDGTTSWVSRVRIYNGPDDLPEGYDIKIDPSLKDIRSDNTLSEDGALADAKATGDAIKNVQDSLDATNKNVAENTNNITNLQNSLGETNQNVDNNTLAIVGLTTQLEDINSGIDNSNGSISKLQDDLNATNQNVSGNAHDINDIKNDIIGINADIVDNKNAIEDLKNTSNTNAQYKVDKPLDIEGTPVNGDIGQVLESNGDGTTSWVSRARVYVGPGDMPEGYDVQIDPEAEVLELDRTLSVDGGIAEASAVGAAIKNTKEKIATDIATHNTDAAAHTDIRAMITEAKDYILMRDTVTGEEYKVSVENGVLVVDPAVIKPRSITITTMPTKTSYDVGAKFDPTGMVVTAKYNDGTSKPVTGYTYPTTGLTAGTNSVTITYIEAGVTVTVTVAITVVVKCIGISVTTAPTKTQYYIGDTFNPAGMIVAATYTDGTVKAITNYTYNTAALTNGTTTVAISYTESGTTFTTNAIITVVAKYSGLSVTTTPTKTQYTAGEVFNPAGMVVKANYNDGSSKAVTGYTYSTAALTTGTTSITITYTESGITYSATVAITVVAAFDTTILQDFTYTANANGTYTITGWKGTKNGVASTEIVVPNNKYIIVDPVN